MLLIVTGMTCAINSSRGMTCAINSNRGITCAINSNRGMTCAINSNRGTTLEMLLLILTLNLICSFSMSSFTLCINWVWYSLIAPRMCGRMNKALYREKMRNISLAFLAEPSWSRSLAAILVSTRSIRSSYLDHANLINKGVWSV